MCYTGGGAFPFGAKTAISSLLACDLAPLAAPLPCLNPLGKKLTCSDIFIHYDPKYIALRMAPVILKLKLQATLDYHETPAPLAVTATLPIRCLSTL